MRSRRPVRREASDAVIDLGGETVAYELKRSSARRTLALRVADDGAIRVNAPLSLAQRHIETFLRRHADWLREQRTRRVVRPSGPDWREGMELPYLGGILRIESGATPAGTRVMQVADRLICAVPPDDLPQAVIGWYRDRATERLGQRLAAVCLGMGRVPPPWRLSDARTRWGSLSPKGVISLNWRLVKASPAEIDYVVCHELAHFRQRNHSAAFWREVALLCPGYATARADLRRRGRDYMAF